MRKINSWERADEQWTDSNQILLICFKRESRIKISYEGDKLAEIPGSYLQTIGRHIKSGDYLLVIKNKCFKTSTHKCPWVIINSDNKMIGRLNAMRYVLSAIDYDNKKVLKPKKWSKDNPSYNLIINNIKFENLNKDQYNFLYKLKANE